MLALLLSFTTAHANDLDVDCTSPLNQAEMLYCATRSNERTEALMNRLIDMIYDRSDTEGKSKLTRGQKSWLQYRDLNCIWQGDKYRSHDTKAQTEVMECQAMTTSERVEELQAWLAKMGN
jgi:uncharacterized protein YecT (DUF1311 family)